MENYLRTTFLDVFHNLFCPQPVADRTQEITVEKSGPRPLIITKVYFNLATLETCLHPEL